MEFPNVIWEKIIEYTEINSRWYHVLRYNNKRSKKLSNNEIKIGKLLVHIRKHRLVFDSNVRFAVASSCYCMSDPAHCCFACGKNIDLSRTRRRSCFVFCFYFIKSFLFAFSLTVFIIVVSTEYRLPFSCNMLLIQLQ